MRPLIRLCIGISVFAIALPVFLAFLVAKADSPHKEPLLRLSTVTCCQNETAPTTCDYLLANVTITDRLARHGDLRGRAVSREVLERAAMDYAEAQKRPQLVLEMLSRCLPEAQVRYPVGYSIIAHALFKETLRRPAS